MVYQSYSDARRAGYSKSVIRLTSNVATSVLIPDHGEANDAIGY